jgi:hypothetical protein
VTPITGDRQGIQEREGLGRVVLPAILARSQEKVLRGHVAGALAAHHPDERGRNDPGMEVVPGRAPRLDGVVGDPVGELASAERGLQLRDRAAKRQGEPVSKPTLGA